MWPPAAEWITEQQGLLSLWSAAAWVMRHDAEAARRPSAAALMAARGVTAALMPGERRRRWVRAIACILWELTLLVGPDGQRTSTLCTPI